MKFSRKNIAMTTIATPVAMLFLFVILEGGASVALFGYDFGKGVISSLKAQHHVKYDSELGWVNIPDINLQDAYGQRRDVTINSIGVRALRETPVAPLAGKIRVVCSGASFTFGFGVSDTETWCNLLENYQQTIETVNMGQDGYGVDQSFLWYKRNGIPLHPAIHLFTFTSMEFERMLLHDYWGYNKPVLKIENDLLVTTNTPIPRSLQSHLPWLASGRNAVSSLRVMTLVKGFLPFLNNKSALPLHNKEQLAVRILAEVEKLNSSIQCKTVFVYLPMLDDLEGRYDDLRKGLFQVSQANSWLFVDLTDDFKRLKSAEVSRLFIDVNDIKQFQPAVGHYSKTGNEFVAKLLSRKLEQVTHSL